jgi:hypothetical protein
LASRIREAPCGVGRGVGVLLSHPATAPSALPEWRSRSPAVAAMLNPALIASVLVIAIQEYSERRKDPLLAAHAFLIVPLVLHRDTRERLPARSNTHWSKWVSDNPVLVAGFSARALALRGHVREGLRFGFRCGALSLDAGGLVLGQTSATIPSRTAEGDIRDLLTGAQRVGRWLTKLELPTTAFALLGMRP